MSINGVSSNPVEARTQICELKDLILTLFGLIFRRSGKIGNYHTMTTTPASQYLVVDIVRVYHEKEKYFY